MTDTVHGVRRRALTEVHRRTAAPASAVWAVLADGWSYAAWVVGMAAVTGVDAPWPAVGSGLRYAVGAWPVTIPAHTSVLVAEWDRELVLSGRVAGLGSVHLELQVRPDGDGCEVVMREALTSGPIARVPRPLAAPLVTGRNKEALRRLALLAERRA